MDVRGPPHSQPNVRGLLPEDEKTSLRHSQELPEFPQAVPKTLQRKVRPAGHWREELQNRNPEN